MYPRAMYSKKKIILIYKRWHQFRESQWKETNGRGQTQTCNFK